MNFNVLALGVFSYFRSELGLGKRESGGGDMTEGLKLDTSQDIWHHDAIEVGWCPFAVPKTLDASLDHTINIHQQKTHKTAFCFLIIFLEVL